MYSHDSSWEYHFSIRKIPSSHADLEPFARLLSSYSGYVTFDIHVSLSSTKFPLRGVYTSHPDLEPLFDRLPAHGTFRRPDRDMVVLDWNHGISAPLT